MAQDQVNVTLLLAGGHRTQIAVHPQDPLLRTLFAAIQGKGRSEVPAFNLPVEGGKKSLIFSGHDLVGLVTEPAVSVEAPPKVEKSRWLLAESFLEPEKHRWMLDLVAREEGRFQDSTVSTKDPDYRRSKVLFDVPEVVALFRERVLRAAPQWMQQLGVAPFQFGDVEVQLTAHGDGNYFKLHNDSGSPDAATRGLTYVYYFFNEPKAFSGGEFRIYDSVIEKNLFRCGPRQADIEPRNNSVLVFAPHIHHEVLPVKVPSQRFRDNRFTVNGWLRRAS
jgi:Rps23 Pro-64 3,4-dihydroxylase Tpa1-like proline 4-hydroxylase